MYVSACGVCAPACVRVCVCVCVCARMHMCACVFPYICMYTVGVYWCVEGVWA